MGNIFEKLHSRFGDFWWYSLWLFLALRLGDVINAVVGLWLVPKYVPQSELGAVLPLTQIASVLGLPISIFVVTFTKFLNKYRTLGQEGRVKAWLRTFWGTTVCAMVVGGVASVFILPHFFERIRVVSGSLGILIVATAVLTTTAPVFTNALQALKKFRELTILNLFSAPLRLVVMLVTLPIRALSGYMLGQLSPSALQICCSYFVLRKEVHSDVKAEPFWKEDGGKIVKYTVFVTLWFGLGTLLGAVQSIIIRQRLPEIESAAYYMISRFSELATYAGVSLAVVMFPMAAEAQTKGRESQRLLLRTMLATFGFGAACTLGLAVIGKPLFSLIPSWRPYVEYVPDMVILAASQTLCISATNFYSYEAASDRFKFLWYSAPLALGCMAFLVCFTGYTFFEGKLPEAVVQWMGSLHIGTLRNFIWSVMVFMVLNVVCIGAHIFFSRERSR